MRLSFSVFCVAMAALCAVDADQLRGTAVTNAGANTAAVDDNTATTGYWKQRALAVEESRKLKYGTGASSDYGGSDDDSGDTGNSGGSGKCKGGSKGSSGDDDDDDDSSGGSSKGKGMSKGGSGDDDDDDDDDDSSGGSSKGKGGSKGSKGDDDDDDDDDDSSGGSSKGGKVCIFNVYTILLCRLHSSHEALLNMSYYVVHS